MGNLILCFLELKAMARTCNVCKKSFPDNLKACPHCRAKTVEAIADSGGPPSDEWLNLAEEGPSSSKGKDEAPSSAELMLDDGAEKPILSGAVEDSDEAVEIDWAAIDEEKEPNASVVDLDKDAYVEIESPSGEPGPEKESSSMELGPKSPEKKTPPSAAPWEESDIIEIDPHILEEDGGSEVDLGSGPHRPKSSDESDQSAINVVKASPGDLGDALRDDEHEVVEGTHDLLQEAEAGATVAASQGAARDDETVTEVKSKKAGTSGAWVGGGGIGFLIGAAACVGFWFTGIPDQLRNPNSSKSSQPGNPAPNGQTQAKESPSVLLDRGDYARVLADVPPGDPQDPDQANAWSIFAEAKWRSFIEQQAAKSLPWKTNDPGVEEAKTALQKIGTPEALFWLGHIQECVGDGKGARQFYEDGKKKFPKERMFETAIQRLDALAEEVPGPGDKVPQEKTGVNFRARVDKLPENQPFMVHLFRDQEGNVPAEGKIDPNTFEAGDHFWEAVNFAKKGKYDEAISTLDRALIVHKARRFMRQNKSQNPKSDPSEEIFVKTCQELETYWKLRKHLQTAGYLDGNNVKNPVRALEIAIAKANEKKSVGNLQGVLDKLKKDKDVAAIDPEMKDINKGIDALIEAKKKALEELAAINKSAEEKLKEAAGQLKTSEEKRKEITAQLKTKEDQIKQADDQLAAAENTLKEVAARLAQAKLVSPDARGEKLIQGADQIAKMALQSPLPRPVTETTPVVEPMPKVVKTSKVPIPEVSTSNDPIRAELIFSLGLDYYWERKYQSAEQAFQNAIRISGSGAPDARYYYFLGLAQLALGKRDAAETSFQQAGNLERNNQPASPAVSATLERIQGTPRRILDEFRR
jgi:TolA-binding protein